MASRWGPAASDIEQDLPELLLLVAELLLSLMALRLLLCGLLVVTARLFARGANAGASRWAVRLSPAAMRPLVVAALGSTLALTSAAAADAAPSAGLARTAPADAALPAPGWAPRAAPAADGHLPAAGWVAAPPPPAPVPPRLVTGVPVRAATANVASARAVVVRRGDTLWSLAARQLGPGASDAEIAAAWPRWWQANRAAVGGDPDLLMPGTRLVVPSGPVR